MRCCRRFLLPSLFSVFVLALVMSSDRPAATLVPPPSYKVVAWNDLGMHCMDSDYSVFSILPPFNTVHAQVVDPTGQLIESTSGLTVTYEAVADPSGSVNTSSVGKTNYWTYAGSLYGASTVPDVGFTGNMMPGAANTPRPMTFDPASDEWVAVGVPITPYDDLGRKRTYPLMRISVRNASGVALATTDVVLPVSDELDCRLCHASGGPAAAQPAAGWVQVANAERDYRLNILRLHDERQAANPVYASALATAGFAAAGLEATVAAGTPILCAGCHASNALPGTGIAGISPLTAAVHAGHGDVVDPLNGMTLDASANRAACYRCHPGSETRCLRGAMGSAVAADGSLAMQCQSCHGSMAAVGSPNRTGWLEEPSCQQCHTGTAVSNNGQIRYTSVFEPNGAERVAVNATFATNADVPAAGFDLFRFSRGHGGLACEACHGSTHAEYPALHDNDNLGVLDHQGHVGTLVECTSCHAGSPDTVNGGPHGMHPVDSNWVNDHGDAAENGGQTQCRACHGTDYRGTVLSRAHSDRTFSTQFGTKTFFRGAIISCYDCHDGPTDDDANSNHRPTVQNASGMTTSTPVTISLVAGDIDAGANLALRIVQQPGRGTVALSGNVATYIPEPGFAGSDHFTFAANDHESDSNLGVVTIQRGATFSNYGYGYPGTGGVVPSITLSQVPTLGTPTSLQIQNTSGVPAFAALFVGLEAANHVTPFGGVLNVYSTDPYVPLTLPAGGLALPFTPLALPGLVGLAIHVQAVEFDPGASFGFAFTRGLRLVLGN